MTDATGTLLAFTTLPDEASATRLASSLVERRLAACVNILPAGTSIYEWDGEIHQDPEHVLIIKSTEARFERLQNAILELHPYELPEIVAVPISHGLLPYLQWIKESTTP
ncbi:divalent-cation tolerance protein CutA [Thioalkalivibrio sulfidiphilus]|uniref:divalent-cation tolerance protein CutA n=1 Tax=Thioalkalivibrio sulfidiphilus TaxID=1033854 RepID=UPI0003667F13|nr:divalent-cation tolerance protein CutA [Thioalkalivibrio sulfidiphilus]